MNNSLGWLTLFLILAFILYRTKDERILKLLLVGFYFRAILVIFDQYFISLPGGNFDAIGFEANAFRISKHSGLIVFFDLFYSDNLLISRIISIFYTLTDRSEMMAKGISVAIGTSSIYLFYRLTLLVWSNKDIAINASWVFALMPSMCLFSALVLKEVYVTFFLIITLILMVIFIRKLVNKKTNNITLAKFLFNEQFIKIVLILFFAYILKNLHGGIFLGLMTFIMFVVYYLGKEEIVYSIKKKKIRIKLVLLAFVPISVMYLFYLELIVIPYIPNLNEIPQLFTILQRRFDISIINVVNGSIGSNYPAFLVPKNSLEFFPKIVLRLIYFLYSPFPWDIKRSAHILGLFNSVLMIYLSIKFWMNRKKIWKIPEIRFIFLLLVSYIVIYGLGSGNFGTSIRHQTKFIFILICLAAPKLKNFNPFYKRKYNL